MVGWLVGWCFLVCLFLSAEAAIGLVRHLLSVITGMCVKGRSTISWTSIWHVNICLQLSHLLSHSLQGWQHMFTVITPSLTQSPWMVTHVYSYHTFSHTVSMDGNTCLQSSHLSNSLHVRQTITTEGISLVIIHSFTADCRLTHIYGYKFNNVYSL